MTSAMVTHRSGCCVTLLSCLCFPASTQAQKMYFSGSEGIYRADLDGAHLECLIAVTPSRAGSRPGGIALDACHGKMYWTDYRLKMIRRANLDGSNVEDLPFKCDGNPTDIALDASCNMVFWTEELHREQVPVSGSIQWAHVSGVRFDNPLAIGRSQGLAVDAMADWVYWGEFGRIQRARSDWSETETVVFFSNGTLTGPALDLNAERLYFLSPSRSEPPELRLQRARIGTERIGPATSQVEDLVVTRNCRWGRGIALDTAGGRVYWIAEGWSPGGPYPPKFACIQRANLDGTNAEGLVYSWGNISGIALDFRSNTVDSAGSASKTLSSHGTWCWLGAAVLALLGLAFGALHGIRRRQPLRQAKPRRDKRILRAVLVARLRRGAKWACLSVAALAYTSWVMSTCWSVLYKGWGSVVLYGMGIIKYERVVQPLPDYMKDRLVHISGEPAPGWYAGSPSLAAWRDLLDQKSWARCNKLLGLGVPRWVKTNAGGAPFDKQLYTMPLWVPSLLFSVLSVILFRRDRRRSGAGHCFVCGYDLCGNVSGICPECGSPIPDEVKAALKQMEETAKQ
jgi:hypothetical protein